MTGTRVNNIEHVLRSSNQRQRQFQMHTAAAARRNLPARSDEVITKSRLAAAAQTLPGDRSAGSRLWHQATGVKHLQQIRLRAAAAAVAAAAFRPTDGKDSAAGPKRSFKSNACEGTRQHFITVIRSKRKYRSSQQFFTSARKARFRRGEGIVPHKWRQQFVLTRNAASLLTFTTLVGSPLRG